MAEQNQNQISRPPVVVVMGHIDHGKSTLLDYIRKTNVVEKEAGGITQHISAYEVDCEIGGQKRTITFLDTPGHEAFCSVRERGAQVADMVVLVVSAEDGVKPQTIEILKCIKNDKTPFIVALNKIDRPGADIDRVKTELAENDVLVEGWGGDVPIVPISAKTGEKIEDLLEIIILQADLEGFSGNKNLPGNGFVIESNLNPKQGISATLIVKDGSIRIGDFVATEGAYARIRSIQNFKGENIDEASFSSPIKIVGWNETPAVGKAFKTFSTKEEAVEFTKVVNKPKNTDLDKMPLAGALFTVVVKTDAAGSLEAVEQELHKLSNEKIVVRIVNKGIGTITETDIKAAGLKKSLVLGFNVDIDKSATALALRDNIEIKNFNIIYELIDFVKNKIKNATPVSKVETLIGAAKILRTFSKNKEKQVIGGRVLEGEIKVNNSVKIFRRDTEIGEGRIKEIQVQKIKTGITKTGEEFGMMIESKIELVESDVLKAIEMIEQQ